METTTKSAQVRSSDRVLEALATLAALLDRTMKEVKTLDSEFQQRLLETIHDTEISVQHQATQHLQQALEETELRIRRGVTEEMRAQFEVEMRAAIDSVRQELQGEREKLNRELDRATEAAAQWEAERARLNAELARVQDALAEARSEQKRLFEEAEKAKAALHSMPDVPAPSSALVEEIDRVQQKVREISAIIDDPAVELSTVIRKNVERAELEAYLRGIRFAGGGGSAAR